MTQQIKVIVTDTNQASQHEIKVNSFLKSNIELVSIQNEVNKGRVFKQGISQPEIVTIITYKEMLDSK